MKASFFSKTLKAGIFFILPIALVVVVVIKVYKLLYPIADGISKTIDPNSVFPFLSHSVVVIIFLLIIFIGGLLEGKFIASKNIIKWVEENILSLIPTYQLIKNTTQEKIGVSNNTKLKVVLVQVDGWMLGFITEELTDEMVLVYVPSSPDPNGGSLGVFNKTDIKPTDISVKDAYKIIRSAGFNSAELWKDTFK